MSHGQGGELRDRLRYAMQVRGITTNALDRAAGLVHGYTSRIAVGIRTNPSALHLGKLAAALSVRPEWLLTGDGPMEAPRSSTARLQDRPEWPTAMAAARDLHPYVPERIWERVGQIIDDAIDLAGPLDGPLVGGIGAALYGHEQRTQAHKVRQSDKRRR